MKTTDIYHVRIDSNRASATYTFLGRPSVTDVIEVISDEIAVATMGGDSVKNLRELLDLLKLRTELKFPSDAVESNFYNDEIFVAGTRVGNISITKTSAHITTPCF